MDPETERQYQVLLAILRNYSSCLVAYSGGVDSVLLAYAAHRALGDQALAVIADSPSLPRAEFSDAVHIAEEFGFALKVVKTGEFSNPDYVANPLNRCFHCKHELFSKLEPIAVEGGFRVICYGENASDVGDYRPGAQAAAEFQVRAPLKEAGLSKTMIRKISRSLGLPTSEKPQMACLSSRIPYGEVVNAEKLRMIEMAEKGIRDMGFHDVRVRHHELTRGALARIEIGAAELGKVWSDRNAEMIHQRVSEAGFAQVTLDLKGYRRGSLNEGVFEAG